MDVASDEDIARGFAHLKTRWDGFDILVHAVAFAPREALTGTFIEATTPRGLSRGARHLELQPDGARARLAAVHAGPRRRHPDLELPGRRALAARLQRHGTGQGEPRGQCALSGGGLGAAWESASTRYPPGPIKTLSAAGIPGLRKMLAHVAAVSPIKRNVTIEDVGNAAAFLCSDLAAGITGEVTYVDGGFNSVGMSFPGESDGRLSRRAAVSTQPRAYALPMGVCSGLHVFEG